MTTDADLVVLGLLAERPRHGYDLEAVIEQRGIRAWTPLAFSSIYYVLGRLESRGWVVSEREGAGPKGRRVFRPTREGLRVCTEGTRRLLTDVTPQPVPLLVGVANSPLLSPGELSKSLSARRISLLDQQNELAQARAAQEPLEVFVAAVFTHSRLILEAELAWVDDTLARLALSDPSPDRRPA